MTATTLERVRRSIVEYICSAMDITSVVAMVLCGGVVRTCVAMVFCGGVVQ